MEKEQLWKQIEKLADEGKNDEAYPLLLEVAHTYNDPEAYDMLAIFHFYPCLKSGIDYKKAFQFFLLACKTGADPTGVVGSVMENYDESVEVDIDAKEGYKNLLDYLMEQEWPAAFIYAGDEYLGYDYVYEPDKEKGIACYKKAIELGENFGYDCLGKAYYTGSAGVVDYQKAYEYYTATDEFNGDEKYFYLGEMYYHGYYVEKDLQKAKEYYEGLINDEIFKDTDSMYIPLAKKRLLEMEV